MALRTGSVLTHSVWGWLPQTTEQQPSQGQGWTRSPLQGQTWQLMQEAQRALDAPSATTGSLSPRGDQLF